MTAAVFAMATAHVVTLGNARYLPIIVVLGLIVVLGKRIYLPADRWWYQLGCGLFILASAVPSFLYGNKLAYAYVAFGILNFVTYPIFERIRLTNLHLLIILAGLTLTLVPLSVGRRVVSLYGNPNNYSAVVFSTMYFGMLLFRGRLLLQLGVLAVFSYLIFIGASRSMLGAMGVFALLYFGQAYLLRRTLKWVLVAGFLVTSFGYYSLITSDEFRIMETIQANTYSDKRERGLSHRDALFYQSLKLVGERPTGYGLGMSNTALRDRFGEQISPHNTYLKVAVEGGVLALVGFLVLILGFWLSSTSPLASSFLFALMLRGFFESATPLSLSLISGMLILPMFLNERTVRTGYRLRFFEPAERSAA